jgi:23S rRNA pseudouridine2457 synthase
MLLAFHKPFGVLSSFRPDGSRHRTLSEFGFPPRVYPLGRLDAESEGLLLLSDEPELNAKLLRPERRHRRVYWAEVERVPDAAAIERLRKGGILLGPHRSLPAMATLLAHQGRAGAQPSEVHRSLPAVARLLDPQPEIAPRDPPIRFRKNVPTAWIELELVEGRNHQVRRMTAAIGHPTLRLIRVGIGDFSLGNLPSGKWRPLDAQERRLVFA